MRSFGQAMPSWFVPELERGATPHRAGIRELIASLGHEPGNDDAESDFVSKVCTRMAVPGSLDEVARTWDELPLGKTCTCGDDARLLECATTRGLEGAGNVFLLTD